MFLRVSRIYLPLWMERLKSQPETTIPRLPIRRMSNLNTRPSYSPNITILLHRSSLRQTITFTTRILWKEVVLLQVRCCLHIRLSIKEMFRFRVQSSLQEVEILNFLPTRTKMVVDQWADQEVRRNLNKWFPHHSLTPKDTSPIIIRTFHLHKIQVIKWKMARTWSLIWRSAKVTWHRQCKASPQTIHPLHRFRTRWTPRGTRHQLPVYVIEEGLIQDSNLTFDPKVGRTLRGKDPI
jgi:hypothetical protein